MWYIYKHTSPSGKVYIGITHLKPIYRWNNGKGYVANNHFYNAICKYGWDAFKHEIIETVETEKDAVRREAELIAHYDSANTLHGYNVALGGHYQSEESRRKIGETRKARGYTSPTLGKHLSEETRRKISEATMGRKVVVTKEWAENIRRSKLGEKNPNFGKRPSEEQIAAHVERCSIPVIRISEDGKTEYKSAAEAQRLTGVCSTNICRVCNGERKTAGGFVWEYATRK